MTPCEASVRHARLSAGAAALGMLIALWISVMLPLSPYEPLYEVVEGSREPVCLRSHWTRSHPYGDLWALHASVPLGTPTHTTKLLVRLDVSATNALAAQTGLSQVHAEQVVALARNRASHLNAIMVVRGDRLVSSLDNPLLDPSQTLTDCVQPHAYASVSVCTDHAYLLGDPNRAPSARNRKLPVAVIVTPRSLLSAQAQLLDAHGELYVHSGAAETAAVAVGATSLCTFAGGSLANVRLRGGAASDLRTFGASRTSAGSLVATVGLQPARCAASAASTAVPLFPIASAHATTLMQSALGTGLADASAFDAHACGASRLPNNESATVLSCAASTSRCAGGVQFPLVDVARRAVALSWQTTGAHDVQTYAQRSDAYPSSGEVPTAAIRLVALIVVAILVDRRATHGLSGERILRTATLWASGDSSMIQLVPLGQSGDDESDQTDDQASPTADAEWLPPLCVLGLRLVQFFFSLSARQANNQGIVMALDATSMAASLFVWILRVSTPCQTRVQTLTVMGGSAWLVDSLVCVLNISTHLPLGESLTAHGFSSLARVAMGLVILTHAMPRSVLAIASASVMATSDQFYDSFKYASFSAVVAWMVILLCTSAIVGSQLVRVVLMASADNFAHFETAAVGALFPISAWILVTTLSQLKDPCGDLK